MSSDSMNITINYLKTMIDAPYQETKNTIIAIFEDNINIAYDTALNNAIKMLVIAEIKIRNDKLDNVSVGINVRPINVNISKQIIV